MLYETIIGESTHVGDTEEARKELEECCEVLRKDDELYRVLIHRGVDALSHRIVTCMMAIDDTWQEFFVSYSDEGEGCATVTDTLQIRIDEYDTCLNNLVFRRNSLIDEGLKNNVVLSCDMIDNHGPRALMRALKNRLRQRGYT